MEWQTNANCLTSVQYIMQWVYKVRKERPGIDVIKFKVPT